MPHACPSPPRCGGSRRFSIQALTKWPAPPGHPGHEAVARVIEPADGFKGGDLVLTVPHIWNSMCFARYQAIDAPHVLRLPEGVPESELLMAQQLGTVMESSILIR